MTKRLLVAAFYFLTIGCEQGDADIRTPGETLQVAASLCNKRPEDMQWLKTLLEKTRTDYSLAGDLYAGRVDDQVIFIHQPLIVSCLACVLYDCEGNALPAGSIAPEDLQLIMGEENRIHRAYDTP